MSKLTIQDLLEMKASGRKFSCVCCYDYTTARFVAQAGAEMILVGDSAAQYILGYDSTLPATMEFMLTLTEAVRRAAPEVCLIADMPFLSWHTSLSDAIKNAGRFVQYAHADIIKIETVRPYLDTVKAVSDTGMAVMSHLGICPQRIGKMGKLKAEGTTVQAAYEMIQLAHDAVAAGASMLLLEGTARQVAGHIARQVRVPVLSCGSGPDCDGQVLIIHDILGLSGQEMPKFAKSFTSLSSSMSQALSGYVKEVRSGSFPDDNHSYNMKAGQWEQLQQMLTQWPSA